MIFFFSTDDTFEVKKKNDTFEIKKTDNTFDVKKPSVRSLPEESRSVLLTNNSGNFVPNATGLSEGYATASFMSSTSLQSHVVVCFNDFFFIRRSQNYDEILKPFFDVTSWLQI